MKDMTGPARILVAEDDSALRRLIEMLLTNEGFDVMAVGDGNDALEVFDDFAPDALVCDVMMPKRSGLSVCRELRAGQSPDVPIILLTARCFDEDIQAVLELGGTTFMNKPFHPRQLVAALDAVLPAERRTDQAVKGAAKKPIGWLAQKQASESSASN